MSIDTDSGVRRIINRKYSDVTTERLKRRYPTGDWQARYRKAVWGGQ